MDAFRQACKTTKRLVEVRLIYIRYISDIDDLAESFRAAFGLDMYWKATDEDMRQFKANPATFAPGFIPTFEFPNTREVTLERRPLVSGSPFKVTPDGMNFLRTFVSGVFMASFDLVAYPFDIQNLTVVMDMSFDPKEDVLLVPGPAAFPLDSKQTVDGTIVQFNRAFSSVQVSRYSLGILMRVALLVRLFAIVIFDG